MLLVARYTNLAPDVRDCVIQKETRHLKNGCQAIMAGSLIVLVHEGKIQRTNKHSHLRKQCAERVICLKIIKKVHDEKLLLSLTVVRKTTKTMLESTFLNVYRGGFVLVCSKIC